MPINANYKVSEGNYIGGQEPQALGVTQKLITASVAVTKGMLLEITGDWTVGPAAVDSQKVCGIALMDAAIDEKVTFETEGFVKLSASAAAIVAGDKIVSAGNGYVKKMAAIDVTASPSEATIETALKGLNAVIGIAIAGCASGGNPYVKLSI